MDLRQMTPDDASEVAELIYASINVWYRDNGHPGIQFGGGPGRHRGLLRDLRRARARRDRGRRQPRERADHGLVLLPSAPDARRARDHERASELLRPGRGQGAPAAHLRLHGRARPPGAAPHLERPQPRFVRALLALAASSRGSPTRTCGCRCPREVSVRPSPVASACAPRRPPTLPRWRRSSSRSRACRAAPDYPHAIENAQGFWSAAVLEGASGGIDGYAIASGHAAHEHHRPARRPHARPTRSPSSSYALDLYPGGRRSCSSPSEQPRDRRGDVRVGRAHLGAALLPGARCVPAVPWRQHADVHARDRLGAERRRPARCLDWLGARVAHDPCLLPRPGARARRRARPAARHGRGAGAARARPMPSAARAFLDSDGPLHDPFALGDMAEACALIEGAIAGGRHDRRARRLRRRRRVRDRARRRGAAAARRRGRAVPAEPLRARLRRRGRERRGARRRRRRPADHRRLRHRRARGRRARP